MKKELQQIDWKHLWHPYTEITAFERTDFPIIEQAEGVYLHTIEGKKLLDGIETKEDRCARILQGMGVKAKHLKGKTNQDLNIFIQNILGEHAKGTQIREMRDYKELLENVSIDELIKILEHKRKG